MNTEKSINEEKGNAVPPIDTHSFPCKKIKAGTYEYRGWIISCVGYYEPERRVCWEGYDPETGCGDFHGFSKREIKWLIDESLSKLTHITII